MDDEFAPLERLIMCCQPLYDSRISELCNKIRSLEYELFWSRDVRGKLAEIIKEHGRTINCSCLACHIAERTSVPLSENDPCIWQPIFEDIVKECGLTISPGELSSTKTFIADLCSGIRGDWVGICGVGTNPPRYSWEINKYKDFFNKIKGEIYKYSLKKEKN